MMNIYGIIFQEYGNIYNLTDDVLISGEPKFGKDKPRQWNILQVFPEILDFIKESSKRI